MKSAVPALLILIGVAGVPLQSVAQVPTGCPTVLVKSAAEANRPDAAEFDVSVQGGSAEVNALYNWTVSAGYIASGQGTSHIWVDTNGLTAGTVITAMVEVLGYPGSCDTAASAATTVVKKAYKVFEGAYTDDAELTRLLDILIEERPPEGKAYVVLGFGSAAPAGELDRVKATAKAHLEGKGQNLEDFPFLDGGKSDRTTIEFWLARPGDDAPALGADG